MLENFALDAETFGNPLVKWQLWGLRVMGFIFARTDCFKLFHFVRGIIVAISIFILVCAQALSIWLHSYNFDRLSPALGAIIVYLNISAKIIAFYFYRKKYNILLTNVQTGVKKVLATSLPREVQIYKSYIKYITTMDYVISMPFSITLGLVLLDGLYFVMHQDQGWGSHVEIANSPEPLPNLFEMFPTGSLHGSFFVAYVIPFYMSSIGVCCLFTWHTFNAALMRYVSFRLDVVKHKLANMTEYVDHLLKKLQPLNYHELAQQQSKLLKYIFVSSVEDFTEVKLFSLNYELVSSVTIFVESSTISGLLCMQLYRMSMDFSSGYGLYQLWGVATIGILWLYYWHANEISYKSDEITNAIYSFNWYDVPLSLRKDIALLMCSTIKPITMRTGFIYMNTNSFLMILKTSYSYFTLLQNFAK